MPSCLLNTSCNCEREKQSTLWITFSTCGSIAMKKHVFSDLWPTWISCWGKCRERNYRRHKKLKKSFTTETLMNRHRSLFGNFKKMAITSADLCAHVTRKGETKKFWQMAFGEACWPSTHHSPTLFCRISPSESFARMTLARTSFVATISLRKIRRVGADKIKELQGKPSLPAGCAVFKNSSLSGKVDVGGEISHVPPSAFCEKKSE